MSQEPHCLDILLSACFTSCEEWLEPMPYRVDIKDAQQTFPDYCFIRQLTPSEQKAAFHVKDKAGNNLCLKLIAPNYERDRLDREIQALQTIDHPNVVRLIEYTFSSKAGQQRHYIIRGIH